MDLTFFSLAALLLVLAGSVAPAQTGALPEDNAALMRQLFGNFDRQQDASSGKPGVIPPPFQDFLDGGRGWSQLVFHQTFPLPGRTRSLLVFATVPVPSGYGCEACNVLISAAAPDRFPGQSASTVAFRSDFLDTGWRDLLLTRNITSNVPGGLRRKLYKTRFGFANGAYRALGPPSGGPTTDLKGWYRG